MKDVYIVTHTQSQHHADSVVGGWFDTDLSDLGRRQARATAVRLQALMDRTPDAIWCSDLARAAHTAAILGEVFRRPVSLDADLREMSYGSAGGRPLAWMERHESYTPRAGDRMGHRSVPDGESRRELATRAYRVMDRILESEASSTLVVTHGFTLTFLVAAWVGMPLESTGYINLRSTAGGITHLREDDLRFNRNVMRLDDAAHLAGLT